MLHSFFTVCVLCSILYIQPFGNLKRAEKLFHRFVSHGETHFMSIIFSNKYLKIADWILCLQKSRNKTEVIQIVQITKLYRGQ